MAIFFKLRARSAGKYLIERCYSLSLIMSTTSKSRVSFASLTPNNIGTVRKLNSVLFPIKYTEKFYEGILNPQVENFCKLGARVALSVVRHSDTYDHFLLVYYNDVPGW